MKTVPKVTPERGEETPQHSEPSHRRDTLGFVVPPNPLREAGKAGDTKLKTMVNRAAKGGSPSACTKSTHASSKDKLGTGLLSGGGGGRGG